ncbi:dihydroflavonal-4-reductase [Thermoascus aurantiacus ATCC 26904]
MADPLVFITGGTGFIGFQVVAATLKARYRVRLSIRKPEQEQVVRERYPEFASKIETVIIPDITKSEAFKDALNNGSDVKTDYVDPAVRGTESILYAAMKFPQIKKVIVVSSVLALLPVTALLEKEVSVKDNTGEVIPINLDMAFPDGFIGHGLKYSASKILAHQATREFLKKNRPNYILITFHPTFVLGESLVQQSAEDIDGINALFWQSLFSEKPRISTAWVHVQDVADAHVKALEVPVESGKEFLLSAPTSPGRRPPTLSRPSIPPWDANWNLHLRDDGGSIPPPQTRLSA